MHFPEISEIQISSSKRVKARDVASCRFKSFYYCRLQAVVLHMPWNKALSSFGKPTAAAYLSAYPILRYTGRGPVTSKIHQAIRNRNIQWWCFTVPVLLAASIMSSSISRTRGIFAKSHWQPRRCCLTLCNKTSGHAAIDSSLSAVPDTCRTIMVDRRAGQNDKPLWKHMFTLQHCPFLLKLKTHRTIGKFKYVHCSFEHVAHANFRLVIQQRMRPQSHLCWCICPTHASHVWSKIESCRVVGQHHLK